MATVVAQGPHQSRFLLICVRQLARSTCDGLFSYDKVKARQGGASGQGCWRIRYWTGAMFSRKQRRRVVSILRWAGFDARRRAEDGGADFAVANRAPSSWAQPLTKLPRKIGACTVIAAANILRVAWLLTCVHKAMTFPRPAIPTLSAIRQRYQCRSSTSSVTSRLRRPPKLNLSRHRSRLDQTTSRKLSTRSVSRGRFGQERADTLQRR